MYIFLQKALNCTFSGDFHTGEYDDQKTSFSVLRKVYIFLQKGKIVHFPEKLHTGNTIMNPTWNPKISPEHVHFFVKKI